MYFHSVAIDLKPSQLCGSVFFTICLLNLPFQLFRNMFCCWIFLEIVQCLIEVFPINVASNWVRYHCCKWHAKPFLLFGSIHFFYSFCIHKCCSPCHVTVSFTLNIWTFSCSHRIVASIFLMESNFQFWNIVLFIINEYN